LPRVISSVQTLVMKFIFPLLWISGFGAGTVTLLATRPAAFPWQVFPVFWLLGTLSWYWFGGRLKKVTIEQDGLLISNYRREVLVPWQGVAQVSGGRWFNTRQVRITFDHDIGFGTSIVFMPKTRFLWPGQEHPIAGELRDLVRRQGNFRK
jgi:hypothetical protein